MMVQETNEIVHSNSDLALDTKGDKPVMHYTKCGGNRYTLVYSATLSGGSNTPTAVAMNFPFRRGGSLRKYSKRKEKNNTPEAFTLAHAPNARRAARAGLRLSPKAFQRKVCTLFAGTSLPLLSARHPSFVCRSVKSCPYNQIIYQHHQNERAPVVEKRDNTAAS